MSKFSNYRLLIIIIFLCDIYYENFSFVLVIYLVKIYFDVFLFIIIFDFKNYDLCDVRFEMLFKIIWLKIYGDVIFI